MKWIEEKKEKVCELQNAIEVWERDLYGKAQKHAVEKELEKVCWSIGL